MGYISQLDPIGLYYPNWRFSGQHYPFQVPLTGGGPVSGTALLSGRASISLTAKVSHFATVNLTGRAFITTNLNKLANALLACTATITPTTNLVHNAKSTLLTTSTLTTTVSLTHFATTVLSARAFISTHNNLFGTTLLSTTATLTPKVTLIHFAKSTLSTTSTLNITGTTLVHHASCVLTPRANIVFKAGVSYKAFGNLLATSAIHASGTITGNGITPTIPSKLTQSTSCFNCKIQSTVTCVPPLVIRKALVPAITVCWLEQENSAEVLNN